GLSTDCRRVEGPWRDGLRDDRAHLASRGGRWTGRHASRADVARVYPGTPAQLVRRRFLHRGDDLAATAVRAVLHRAGSRRVHLAGCTPNPSDLWVTQQARQLTWTLAERREPVCFLMRVSD